MLVVRRARAGIQLDDDGDEFFDTAEAALHGDASASVGLACSDGRILTRQHR